MTAEFVNGTGGIPGRWTLPEAFSTLSVTVTGAAGDECEYENDRNATSVARMIRMVFVVGWEGPPNGLS